MKIVLRELTKDSYNERTYKAWIQLKWRLVWLKAGALETMEFWGEKKEMRKPSEEEEVVINYEN